MARRTRRAIARPPAFWDTSALVPLCVRQNNTVSARAAYSRFQVVVWWASSVEIASALARLVRMKVLTPADWMKARQLASTLADSWSMVQPSDAVRTEAVQLVERYDLRAADALQLAGALQWCLGQAHGQVFFAADDRLLDAATLSGFDARRI